jgi:hypothetical protein
MPRRKLIAVFVAALMTVEADAASLSQDRLVACAGMPDSAARLACYDREVAPVAREVAGRARASRPAAPEPEPATTPAPEPATVPLPASATVPAPAPTTIPLPATATVPAPPTSSAASFGQEQLTRDQRAASKEELTLHARLSSQKSAGPGLFNLYLDNGQVWRHEDQVSGSYLKDGEAITIEKGALGSYKLTRDAGKPRNWIRVTRVR